ncbi:MAG: hypothetical protein OER96_05795, partial [Gammaproteobacteria bacterium]|nr:hypothetical protein [Gammaproteobacteria bacterium]
MPESFFNPATKMCFVTTSLLLFSLVINITQAQDYTKSTAELNALRKEIDKVKSALEKDVGTRDHERAKLREVEKKLATLNHKQRETDNKIKNTQAEIVNLEDKRSTLEQKSKQLTNGMAGLARATYIMGRQEYIKLLLQQQQPEKVNRALVYYRYLAQSRLQRVDQVNAHAQEMSQLAALTRTHSDELRLLQEQLAAEETEAEQLRVKRESSLAAIQGQISSQSKEIDRLRADEKR